MIECPICHVMNEDQAFFCSECGQRFSPAGQTGGLPQAQPQMQQPQPPQMPGPNSQWQTGGTPLNAPPGPPQPPQGLPQAPPGFPQAPPGPPQAPSAPPHAQSGPPQAPPGAPQSPSYGGGMQPFAGSAPAPQPNPQGGPPGFPPPAAPPFASAAAPPTGGPDTFIEPGANTTNKRPRLHSPLLGDDPALPEERVAAPHVSRGQLRSPLLRGEDDPDADPRSNKQNRGASDMYEDHTAQSGSKGRKLHSPLLGGEDEPSQPTSGRNTGANKGLRSPLLGGEDDDAPRQRSSGRSGALHSPLLGGDDDDDQDIPRQRSSGRSGALHSPLLGGDDDAEETPRQRRSGPLRSPLLSGDDSDFDRPATTGQNKMLSGGGGGSDRTEFPHRRRREDWSDEDQADQSKSGSRSGKMRSPLLGGGGDADSDPNAPKRRVTDPPKTTTGGHRRLHSPVLDGTGEFNYEDYQRAEEQGFPDSEPAVVRSPLLGSSRPLPADRPKSAPPASAVTPPTLAERPVSTPQLNEPVSNLSSPVVIDATPMPSPVGQSMSPSSAKSAPSPVSQPEPFRPKTRATGTNIPAEKEITSSRVPLSIYDSGLRETLPGQAPAASGGPIMVLLVPAVIALIFHLGYVFLELLSAKDATGRSLNIFATNPWFAMDAVGQALVLIGLIIFALKGKR